MMPTTATNMKRRTIHALASLALFSTIAAGCSRETTPSFQATDITGAGFAREFTLTDHHGKTRTLTDFAGKVVVIFFGFTQCPDVCPTTLALYKAALAQLGAQAAKDVQVLFVSVDPERDTQEILSHYVPAFDASFLGLRGDDDATKKTAREFKVFYAKVPGTTEGTYTVDHTAASYVFDRQGKVRLMVKYNAEVAAIVSDLKQLL